MIISRVFGGVGNQLFIFATSYALAKKTNQKLVFDYISAFKQDKVYKRKIDLFYFDGINKIISKKYNTIFNLCGLILRYYFQIFFFKKPFFGIYYINDKNINRYSFEELSKAKIVYLDGYFQDVKLFADYQDEIKFLCSTSLSFGVQQIKLKEEHNYSTICIHVRNYSDVPLKDKSDNLVLDCLYYTRAIEYIKQKVALPYFIIFSDDIEAAKKMKLASSNIEYIENNNDIIPSHIKDLQLMASCSHFIIANSTFSWWAAFLGSNSDKMVLRSGGDFYVQNSNFYLSDWIIIN